GSTIGITIVGKPEELRPALDLARRYDPLVLVEEYLQGVEITGAVLGNRNPQALPLVEIVPGEQYGFFTYEAKYTPGATREICPARLSETLTQKAQEYAVRAHKALKCRGYSRTDMIACDNEVYILETNTIPGMTATSLFPQAAAAAGISFPQLLDRLIELALEKD
ncbi:MAG TPA: D-alanine--D-alanine ligase, partial [Syntrophobacteria bacterium]|nr:D-alanine--D-alanine ligase [Syntrophobacteria bacterium]